MNGHMVEGIVLERERLCGRVDQLDLPTETSMGDRKHLGALIDARDRVTAPAQLRRDKPGAGRDVENVPAAGQARDKEASPAWVLPQREHGADAVVRRPERGEQRAGAEGRMGHACDARANAYPRHQWNS